MKCFLTGNASSDRWCHGSGAEIPAYLFMEKLRHRKLALSVRSH